MSVSSVPWVISIRSRGCSRSASGDPQARDRGFDRLHVDANDHALAFYQDVGFVVVERVALDHGTALRMVLDLDA